MCSLATDPQLYFITQFVHLVDLFVVYLIVAAPIAAAAIVGRYSEYCIIISCFQYGYGYTSVTPAMDYSFSA